MNKKLLCLNCKKNVFLTFEESKPKEILIKCNQCGYNQYTPIHQYLTQITDSSSHFNENDSYCKEHRNKPISFCEKCKLYLCSQCEHNKKHQLINLSTIIPTNTIKDKINEGYKHINNYCLQLKVNKQNELLHQINQIEYAYQSFQRINSNILILIEVMINNYQNNSHNYYLKSNTRNIPEINIYNIVNENTIENIIEYYNNYTLIKNNYIDFSNFKGKKIIEEKNRISSVIILSDGKIAVSVENTIKIYNPNDNYHCDIEINSKDKIMFQLDNTKIVSYSDNKINIWNIKQSSLECEYSIEEAHSKEIEHITKLSDNRMASCSSDRKIRIWSSNYPYKLIKSIHSKTGRMKFLVQRTGKEILLSLCPLKQALHVWNLSTYQRETIIDVIDYFETILELDENRIMIGRQNLIIIFNFRSYEIEQQISNDKLNYIKALLLLRNGYVLCCCINGMVCVYDSILNSVKFKASGLHKEYVTNLFYINNRKFISCSHEDIKIWNY